MGGLEYSEGGKRELKVKEERMGWGNKGARN